MEMQKQKVKALQWHPAFFAGIQIELEAESENLIFENEHQLGTKPKEIDVLIIKKESGKPIHKNIGRIFRTYNIIEYKSPDDYLSVDDFYKVYGYVCFYKADAKRVDSNLHKSVMNIIVTANKEKFEEVRDMCEALEELMKEELEEREMHGEEKVNTLNKKLADACRTDDIIRAAADKEFQKKLFEEFGIK